MKLSATQALTGEITKLTLLEIKIFPLTYHTKSTPSTITGKSILTKVFGMVLNIWMSERLILRIEMVPLNDFFHVRKR
jgi:hypothetical protein